MNGHTTPMSTIRWLAATAALTLIAGCGPTAGATTNSPAPRTPAATPSSPSSSPTTPTSPSQSPTSSLSADQQAALDALTNGDAVYARIGHDPAAFTEKQIRADLKKVAIAPLLTNMIDSMLALKDKGYREQGSIHVLSTQIGKVEKTSTGKRVVIKRCKDQRELIVVVASSGAKAPGSWQSPEWQLQESAVRQGADGAWYAAGTRPASTKKCG